MKQKIESKIQVKWKACNHGLKPQACQHWLKIYFADKKVDELEKAISKAARDPAKYGIDQPALERRFKWTRTTMTQVVEYTLQAVVGTA
uniref:Uncharacterized protein n=1 Tax=Lactuca sativa TaxID=4236 RepID=A0A9R1WC11_LACSA|nr:hypothetical protein LSAT_V11C200080700 [Lactuca sativa]